VLVIKHNIIRRTDMKIKKLIAALTIMALTLSLAAAAAFAAEDLAGSGITLSGASGTVISAESLLAIRNSGTDAQFVLPNGVRVTIVASSITDNVKDTDINVRLMAVGNTNALNGWDDWYYDDWYYDDWYWDDWGDWNSYWGYYEELYIEWYPEIAPAVFRAFKSWDDYDAFWDDYHSWESFLARERDNFAEWYPQMDTAIFDTFESWDDFWDFWDEYWSNWDTYWGYYEELYIEWYPEVDPAVFRAFKSWDDFYDFWDNYRWDDWYYDDWYYDWDDWDSYWGYNEGFYISWYPEIDPALFSALKSWDDYYDFWDEYWDNWVWTPQPFAEYLELYRDDYPRWYQEDRYPDINWNAFNNLTSWDEYYDFWDNYFDNWVNPYIYEWGYRFDAANGISNVDREIRRETGELVYEYEWWLGYLILIVPSAEGELGFELIVDIPASLFAEAEMFRWYEGDEIIVYRLFYHDSDLMQIDNFFFQPLNNDGSASVRINTGNIYWIEESYSYDYYDDWGFDAAAPAAMEREGAGRGPDILTDEFGVIYDADGNVIDRSALARGGGDLEAGQISGGEDGNPITGVAAGSFAGLLVLAAGVAIVSRKRKA
jgi:hypothetical protein